MGWNYWEWQLAAAGPSDLRRDWSGRMRPTLITRVLSGRRVIQLFRIGLAPACCLRRRHLDKGYARLPQKAAAVLVRVGAGVYHPFNACVNDHLGAGEARLVGYIDHAAGRADAVERSLNNGVLLSVERTNAVAVYHQMPNIVAVR